MRALTILMAAALHAQPPLSPVPAAGSVTCAWSQGLQASDLVVSCDAPLCTNQDLWHFDRDECWLTCYCAVADARLGTGWYPNAVRIGSTMFWQTANVDHSVLPYANGLVLPFFALSRWSGIAPAGNVIGAALGWDRAFGSGHVVLNPQWSTTQTSGGYTFDSHVLSVTVPLSAALVGTVLQCQAARFDPAAGLFYLSSAYAAQIGN